VGGWIAGRLPPHSPALAGRRRCVSRWLSQGRETPLRGKGPQVTKAGRHEICKELKSKHRTSRQLITSINKC
jgi:hypothetical protein